MTTPAPSGPTVRRLIVGSQLRRLREDAGITRAEAGFEIRSSESKISRLELGRVSFKDRDVIDLLKLYGIPPEDERSKALSQMAEEANQPGWWHNYDDVMSRWFQTYVGLEEAASQIRTYEIQFVPGLLQTEDYARAVVTAGMPQAVDGEIERRVRMKLKRQDILSRPEPPKVWAIVDEAALRRPMGGNRVMREQLEHLIELTARPNISIQVVPFRLGGHTAQGGAFTVLRFADEDLPDVVYLEQLVSAVYLDKPEQLDAYLKALSELTTASPPPEEAVASLKRILEQV